MVSLTLSVLAHAGCERSPAREAYAVFWNVYDATPGPGFYVWSANDLSFREPVVHLKGPATCRFIDIELYMFNRTGAELFVAGRDAQLEITAQLRVVSVASSGSHESYTRLGKVEGGAGTHYFRLLNEQDAIGIRGIGSYCLQLVYGRILVGLQPDAAYDEVSIEIPLMYFPLGDRDAKWVTIQKTMRIVWDEAAEAGGTLPYFVPSPP